MRIVESSVSASRWGVTRGLLALILAATLHGAAATVDAESSSVDADWRQDGLGFEGVTDPATALFSLPQPWDVLRDSGGGNPESLLDTVVTLHHAVPIGDGRTLRVNEHFTLRSWLRWPKRAVLLLGSSVARGGFWSIPVAGYNGTEMIARRGMFAYTVDYIGTGDSFRPTDGLDSTFEANLEALKIVMRYIRFHRAVPKIDVVGESWGGIHALYLAADATRVRSCVMSTMTYKIPFIQAFMEPKFRAHLDSLPGHYMPMDADFFQQLTVGAPEEVVQYARTTQPGLYLITHFWDAGKGLPHFDPSVAQVPGLVISGSKDRPEDGRDLAAHYGHQGARFFVTEGAGHGPRLETPASANLYWSHVFEFIDNPQGSGLDED